MNCRTALFRFTLGIALVFSSSQAFAQDATRGASLYQANNCIQCHGNQGQGVESEKGPRIGGQHDWYILKALSDFKARVRENPEMYPYIQALSEQDYKDLAAYVSSLSGVAAE